jgi:hypothetical protein
MTDHISSDRLSRLVALLNRTMKTPETPYTHNDVDKTVKANIGNYHVDYAYGGAALHQMATTGGGINDVFRVGHVSRRALHDLILAFLTGVEHAQKNARDYIPEGE